MKMSNSEIAKLLIENDHLSDDDKEVLLNILGVNTSLSKNKKMTFGDKASEKITGFIGSWKFILISIFGMIAWMGGNTILKYFTGVSADSFPFEFLNVVLACFAAVQAPIIMIAQNKQDKREALKTQSDYEIDLKTIVIIEDLYQKTMEVNKKLDKLTELISQMPEKSNVIKLDVNRPKKKDD